MAMGTTSPSDNTVTSSTSAVAGSGETLPMAANSIRAHVQDRAYGYDGNVEYNRNGDSRSEMLPKGEQARSRSYYSVQGKEDAMLSEQENRQELERPANRSDFSRGRSPPLPPPLLLPQGDEEQLTGQQSDWPELKRQVYRKTSSQLQQPSLPQSTRPLVHLPPIRTQPPSYYENGHHSGGVNVSTCPQFDTVPDEYNGEYKREREHVEHELFDDSHLFFSYFHLFYFFLFYHEQQLFCVAIKLEESDYPRPTVAFIDFESPEHEPGCADDDGWEHRAGRVLLLLFFQAQNVPRFESVALSSFAVSPPSCPFECQSDS
ncbi:hypothetical protein FRC17_000335 [Serendipita sp. 399]|nr:hypothetical protein FRC17_000335 [Serendipita sp. 399]